MERVLVYPLTECVGGVEEFEMNLVRYSSIIDRNKYGYVVLGNSPYEEELRNLSVDFYKLPKKGKLLQNIVKTFVLFKRLRSQYSIVYFNTSALGYIFPYICAILFKYKIVLHSHLDGSKISTPLKKCIQKLNYSIIKKNIARKFACSTEAANWMFNGKIDDVTIIPNAILLERFKYGEINRLECRNKLGINKELIIGNVSRLTYVKNQTFLIDLIKKMNDSGIDSKLLLVGDGEDRERLEKKVKDENLNSRVIFYGKTSKPEYVMCAMDCIVLPSYTEGFPICIIEAQAAGMKCILSDNITKEVNVTGDVFYKSLDNSLDEWVALIKQMDFTRIDHHDELRNKGYDVTGIEKKIYSLLI